MSILRVWSVSIWLSAVLVVSVKGDSCQPAKETTGPAVNDFRLESVPNSGKDANNSNGGITENTMKMTRLPQGGWGGPGILLSISESGAAIEYDCGHGMIGDKLEVDDAGHFHWQGTHEEETGGPSQDISAVQDDGSTTSPSATSATLKTARYEGVVTGEEMTLTVTLVNTGRTIGTFHLRRGELPRLHKCR